MLEVWRFALREFDSAVQEEEELEEGRGSASWLLLQVLRFVLHEFDSAVQQEDELEERRRMRRGFRATHEEELEERRWRNY